MSYEYLTLTQLISKFSDGGRKGKEIALNTGCRFRVVDLVRSVSKRAVASTLGRFLEIRQVATDDARILPCHRPLVVCSTIQRWIIHRWLRAVHLAQRHWCVHCDISKSGRFDVGLMGTGDPW